MSPNLISIVMGGLVLGGMLLVISRVQHPKIADSGWFWLFVFSGMGLLGMIVIGPKYGDRQQRLETRYDARQKIAETWAKQADTKASKVGRLSDSSLTADEQSFNDSNGDYVKPRRTTTLRVPLIMLGTILAIVALVAGALLLRSELPKRRTNVTVQGPHA